MLDLIIAISSTVTATVALLCYVCLLRLRRRMMDLEKELFRVGNRIGTMLDWLEAQRRARREP